MQQDRHNRPPRLLVGIFNVFYASFHDIEYVEPINDRPSAGMVLTHSPCNTRAQMDILFSIYYMYVFCGCIMPITFYHVKFN